VTSRSLEALRRLLLVTAAVCLLGTGGIDLVRGPAGVPPGAGAGPGARAEPVPPATVSALRSALAAATPLVGGHDAPPGGGPGLPTPATGPRQTPTDLRAAPSAPIEGPQRRAPPLTAGT